MPDSPTRGFGRDHRRTDGSDRESASLLLVESLIHGLIERSVLTVAEALEIIDVAADVERQLEGASGKSSEEFKSILTPLAQSLRIDLQFNRNFSETI